MFAKRTYRNTRWVEPFMRASTSKEEKEEGIPGIPGIVPAITRYYPLVPLEIKIGNKWYPVIWFHVNEKSACFVFQMVFDYQNSYKVLYHHDPDRLDRIRVKSEAK